MLTGPELILGRHLGDVLITTGKEAFAATGLSASVRHAALTKLTQLEWVTSTNIRTGSGKGCSGHGLQLTAEAYAYLHLKPPKRWRGCGPQGTYILSIIQRCLDASVEVHLPMTGAAAEESASGMKAPDLLLRIHATTHAAFLNAVRSIATPLGTEQTIPDHALLAIEVEVSSVKTTLLNNYRKNTAAGLTHQLYLVMPTDVKVAKQLLLMHAPQGVWVADALRLIDALRAPTTDEPTVPTQIEKETAR